MNMITNQTAAQAPAATLCSPVQLEVEQDGLAYLETLTENEREAGTTSWVAMSEVVAENAAWSAQSPDDPFAGQSPVFGGESGA